MKADHPSGYGAAGLLQPARVFWPGGGVGGVTQGLPQQEDGVEGPMLAGGS